MGERRTPGALQASGSLLALPQPLLSTFSHLLSIPGLWPGIRGECASFEREAHLVSEYVAEALELRNSEILL